MQSTKVKDTQNFLIQLMKKMKNYMENDQLTTVVLIAGCDGKRVTGHRVVLAAASPYFEAMFLGSMRESKEVEITIGEVRGEILEMLVHYCYSGVIEIDETNVEMVLETADLFQLDTVKAICSKLMASQLDETNCLGILHCAQKHNCINLQEQAQKFVIQNLKKVSEGEEFEQLNAEQLGNLLSKDNLPPRKEDDDANRNVIRNRGSRMSNPKDYFTFIKNPRNNGTLLAFENHLYRISGSWRQFNESRKLYWVCLFSTGEEGYKCPGQIRSRHEQIYFIEHHNSHPIPEDVIATAMKRNHLTERRMASMTQEDRINFQYNA